MPLSGFYPLAPPSSPYNVHMPGDPGKEGRPRQDREVAAEVMRDLAEISRHLGALNSVLH